MWFSISFYMLWYIGLTAGIGFFISGIATSSLTSEGGFCCVEGAAVAEATGSLAKWVKQFSYFAVPLVKP
ncbi:hypothetical protein N8Z70_00435 [Candidatus Puniceispirillum sp.]|nr:hypothetical protein [bacterium]MDC1293495.1 hypothetical protein [Candidatus Puniceispirillum sp.]